MRTLMVGHDGKGTADEHCWTSQQWHPNAVLGSESAALGRPIASGRAGAYGKALVARRTSRTDREIPAVEAKNLCRRGATWGLLIVLCLASSGRADEPLYG